MPAELIAQLEMLGEAIDELAPPVTIADLRVIGLRSVDPGVADHAVDAEVAPVVPLRPRARRIWLAAAAILVVAAFGVAAMLVRQTSSTSSGESPVTLPAQATIGLFPSGGRDGAIAAGYRSPTDVVSAYLAAITSPAALPDGYSVTATLETDAAATSIDADHASVAVSVQTTDDSGDARVFVQRVSTKPDAWQVTSAVVVPGELRGVTLADGRLSGAITTVAGGSTTLSAYDLATGAVLDTVTVTSPEQAGSVPPTPTPFELGVGGHTEVGLRYWNTVAPAGAYRFANFADQAISAGPTPTIGDVTTVLESPSATTTETDQTQNGAITPAAPATHLSADLQVGSSGPDVQAVQQRLADLGFDPGPIDGTYGATTKQAIWAFQSLILDVSAINSPRR